MKLLVVDDEPVIRLALRDLLADAGHTVREAEHAPAALAALDGDAADVVISDLNMPAMNGLALLEEVRSRHPDTLFILLTAHGDERIAVESLRLGAFSYIPKPFDNAELLAAVERAHELLALRRENDVISTQVAFGELTVNATLSGVIGLIEFLRNDPNCRFSTLIDITAVDNPARPARFEYAVHSAEKFFTRLTALRRYCFIGSRTSSFTAAWSVPTNVCSISVTAPRPGWPAARRASR